MNNTIPELDIRMLNQQHTNTAIWYKGIKHSYYPITKEENEPVRTVKTRVNSVLLIISKAIMHQGIDSS